MLVTTRPPGLVIDMLRGAMEIIQRSINHLPVALHLDHEDTDELCALYPAN